MPTLKEISNKISKSSRLKHALFAEDANEVDLLSIFVDFGLAVFTATKEACVKSYGKSRFMNSTDVKKFIKETGFPKDIIFAIR